MATPHADFQDFICADGSRDPKSLGFGCVGLMSYLVRRAGAHLTVAASGCQQHQPIRNVPLHGVRSLRGEPLCARN
jgi:hypothetical protein